jgi:geranylgeranyl reductase family protein
VDQYDVAVIGAGPIGGYLAKSLNELGHSVLLVEEHNEIGRPFQCAGLVNPNAMSKVSLYESVLTEIWGANIHSPAGTPISIGDKTTIRTYSVCRKLFDEGVVFQAINKGTDLLLSTKAVGAELAEDRIFVNLESPYGNSTIAAKLLCGADGAHSWVRRFFKMGRPREMMIGFQLEVTGYDGDPGMLDMYTGTDIAPGFFSWAIPTGETTRIGTWSKPMIMNGRSSEDYLNSLQTNIELNSRFQGCREIGRYCGPVPSGIVKKIAKPRVVLFGDAAGICKPTTGGGIGPGFAQVDLLVPQLSVMLHDNDLDESRMQKISASMKNIRKDQRRKKALRDAFLTEMSDSELEEIFAVWSRPDVTKLINEVGDIENPIPLGIRMLREIPEFRKLARSAAKAILWG